MTPLRVRRYADGLLLDEREITGPVGDELDAVLDAQWAVDMTNAGRPWAVVIDDPTGERLTRTVRLEGGPR